MVNTILKNNPLKTKDDVRAALLTMLTPLERHFSHYGQCYGSDTAQHGDFIAEIEAVLRPLFGIIPLIAGGASYHAFPQYLQKIINGTDPNHEAYWQTLPHEEQRMVEMATIALGMIMVPEHVWFPLTKQEQHNVYHWLNQINDHPIQATNWRFFRVLTNLAFKRCNREHNQERLDDDLKTIDSFYIGRGWYSDGNRPQIDYYVPFAIHFYALIYAKYATFDTHYPDLFFRRAKIFAKTYAAFFADNGEAIPFGRSMTYRFAHAAFFGALALTNTEALPWGQIKRLILQNLRFWFTQNIFTDNGELSVGYYYPNLIMSEGYNAYGSPYWAFKAFIILAVPDDHPFWTSTEESAVLPEHIPLPEARGIIQRDEHQSQFFVVGQQVPLWMSHNQAKYEKFVYSSHFGFSVSKSSLGLSQGAFDNTLAISEHDQFFRMRYGAEHYKVFSDYLYVHWKPWDNVSIKSYIIPLLPWHVRIHFIDTKRSLTLADGGFAINRQGSVSREISSDYCFASRENVVSGIWNLMGTQKPQIVQTEPNTNLMVPLTVIPTLFSNIGSGQHIHACAVLGSVHKNDHITTKTPTFNINNHDMIIYGHKKIVKIKLEV